jgi:hypothetical protein
MQATVYRRIWMSELMLSRWFVCVEGGVAVGCLFSPKPCRKPCVSMCSTSWNHLQWLVLLTWLALPPPPAPQDSLLVCGHGEWREALLFKSIILIYVTPVLHVNTGMHVCRNMFDSLCNRHALTYLGLTKHGNWPNHSHLVDIIDTLIAIIQIALRKVKT